MPSLRFLLALLLLCSFPVLGAGCPTSDDDDSGTDDDDASDDDDDDDDDGTGDDDDATGAPISCDGTLPVIDEAEPNDEKFQAMEAASEGFCIEGTVTCGDESYLDVDLFVFQIAEARTVAVTLDWTGVSDVDKYLYVGMISEEALIAYDKGTSGPEVGSADAIADEDYILQVACWSGQDTPYTLEVRYDEIVLGDDDDSAGDDDDATGDDDDSATGDDDDSATGDDDDSATGDDDDSATGDDDDATSAAPTFSDVWSTVLMNNCGCHTSGNPHWNHNSSQATAYSVLVDQPAGELSSMDRVEPGDALTSYLMHKLDGTHSSVGGSGSTMPIGGTLTSVQIETVRDWINDGAQNN